MKMIDLSPTQSADSITALLAANEGRILDIKRICVGHDARGHLRRTDGH